MKVSGSQGKRSKIDMLPSHEFSFDGNRRADPVEQDANLHLECEEGEHLGKEEAADEKEAEQVIRVNNGIDFARRKNAHMVVDLQEAAVPTAFRMPWGGHSRLASKRELPWEPVAEAVFREETDRSRRERESTREHLLSHVTLLAKYRWETVEGMDSGKSDTKLQTTRSTT